MSRVHYDQGPAEHLGRTVPCPLRFVAQRRATDELADVTCRRCIAWLATQEVAPVEAFVPGAPHPVDAQEWDERGAGIVRRSIDGDDGPRREGWRTCDQALRSWHEATSGSLIASSSSYGGSGGGSSTDHTPGAMNRRGHVLPVDVAVRRACANGWRFDGDAEGRGALELGPGSVRGIVDAYLLDRLSDADIADRLASSLRLGDGGVTAHQVALVWRGVRALVRSELESRGLLPRARASHNRQVASSNRDEGAAVALLPDGFDLEGWTAIAEFMKMSVRNAQREKAERGMPVEYRGGTPIAARSKLQSWNNTLVSDTPKRRAS